MLVTVSPSKNYIVKYALHAPPPSKCGGQGFQKKICWGRSENFDCRGGFYGEVVIFLRGNVMEFWGKNEESKQ